MVKNKGGNKTKKGSRKQMHAEMQRRTVGELMKEEGQEYAVVRKVNGGGRFNVICADKVERIGVARATLKRNKKFIELGQFILVSLRDFQEKFCDIIDIYDGAEVDILVKNRLVNEDFIKQHMHQKEEGDSKGDTSGFVGFTIDHGNESPDDSGDEKTEKKSSIADIWDDI